MGVQGHQGCGDNKDVGTPKMGVQGCHGWGCRDTKDGAAGPSPQPHLHSSALIEGGSRGGGSPNPGPPRAVRPPIVQLPSRPRTGDLVADEFAGLDVPQAAEEAAQLLLAHALGQVVDDQVGFAVVGHRGALGDAVRDSRHRHHRDGDRDGAAA